MKKKAVALKEIHERIEVVAKGKGYVAKKIVEVAKEHNVPIKKDPLLVEKLCEVELFHEIPDELYEYVVKVLDFLYNKKK